MNDLIIYCKYCHKKKKLKSRRDIRPNGNFCSRECYKNWEILNSQDADEKRLKWNKYQKEYKRKRYIKKPRKLKKIRKALIKILKNRLKTLKRTYTCIQF